MTSQEPGNSDDTVEEIYARFMQRFADGEFLDIVDLYAEYPQYASQLRDLHGQQETVAQSEPSRTNLPQTRIVQVQAKRYGILERLAQGGMGVIYKVWDGSLRRELAMKLIRDKRQPKPDEPGVITNPETVARFIREAEITAKLDHPGIVPIHDMGTDEYGRVFFTMRLVRGKRLDQVFELARLQQERWSLTRALDVIVKICETLAFAHSRGVIHRDLKPANIMVGPFGETYVMDWGLAKNISKSSSDDASEVDDCTYAVDRSIRTANTVSDPSSGFMETSNGAIMGTAAYMPPEQAAGLIHELDERSDIYSVGTILYELLAGKRPYFLPDKVRASQIVQAITLGPPVPLRSLNPKVSQELAAICDKAMARKQEDRYQSIHYQSIQEMAEDLRAYLEDRVVRAYQTGAIAELRKWVVRNRGLAISSAVGLVIAAGSLLTIVGVQSAANAKLTEANTTISNASIRIQKETELKGQALEEEQKARKLADEQLRRAEGLLLARASSEVVTTNPALALLLALESHDHCPSFSANSAILAALPLHHEVRTLVGHRAPIQAASVNAQGTRLVTASNDRTAMIWDIATGKPLTCLVGHNDWVHVAKFSPDGQRVATTSRDHTAALWNAETGERLHEFAGHSGIVWQVSFSPDGQRLATGSLDGTARIWDVVTGKELLVLGEHTANVIQVAFSPDGSTLLTGSGDKTARLWDTSSGTEKLRLEGHEGGVGVAQFSADGKLVLTTAAREWIGKRPDTNNLRHPSTDHEARIWNATTGELKITLEHQALVEGASFNHDGSRVVTGSGDGLVNIWNSTTGKVEQTLEFREGAISAVAFSPDGRLVAVGSDRGTVRVWDAATGKDLGRLGGHTDLVTAVGFTSPSQLVTTSIDHTARLWNVVSQGAIQAALTDGTRGTNTIVSPDGMRVLIHSRESRSVALCAFPEGHQIAEWDHEVPVVSVQFSSLGRFVATLSESGIVRVFATADGRLLKKFASTEKTTQVLFRGDRQLVVVEHQSGTVTLWNLETFEMIQRQELPGVKFLRVSPDGQYLLAWFGQSDDLELRTIATDTQTTRLPSITKSPQDLPANRFSNDDKILVTWSREFPTPRVWETETGRLIGVLEVEKMTNSSVGVVFSSDGVSLATNFVTSAVQVWNSQTGQLTAKLSGYETSIARVFMGPQGERVVTRSASKLSRLWNGRTGQSIGLLADRDDFVDTAWFSDDGTVLLTLNAKKDKFSLWDAMRGERRATVANGVHPFTNGALSRDGRWFVTGLADGTARIWPVQPVEHLKSQNLRQLTPDERDLFQIGTEGQRSAYRVTWNENSLVDFLVFQAKAPINGAALTLTARKNAEQAIQTFVESLPPDFTKSQKAAALARVDQALRKKIEPSLPIKVALAAIFVDNEDFQQGERLLRTVLEQGDQSDPAVWNSFAAVALGGLKRSPQEILKDFPKSQSTAAEDLKWVLQTQEAGRTIRIRAGGGDYRSPDGTTWRRDCFFGGGHLFGESFGTPQPSGEPIQKTPDAPLYQTERWFDANRPARERSYRIPLQVGRYRITLHFAEIFFREPESRVLDVLAEGKVALSNYEPLTAGFATAEQREFETRVDDGLLDLEFRSVKNNPKVSAIEIERLGD